MTLELLDQAYTRSLGEHEGDKAVAAIFQRDSLLATPKAGKGKEERPFSLFTYDTQGRESTPTQPDYARRLGIQVTGQYEKVLTTLSTPERAYLGMLAPKLVQALVLDRRFIDKVYGEDLANVPALVLDWFQHPEAVAQTHFRIGYGGEEVVSSRAPAYIVPALETVKRVKKVYADYTNWALVHELHEREGNAKSPEIERFLANQIKAHPQTKDLTDREALEQVHSSSLLPTDQVKAAALKTWEHFLGRPLSPTEFDDIKRKYHTTDELPKVVVFNAANAAIEINGMDQTRVLAARDATQTLLREYVTEFHPELADCLVFQNDRPWNEHNLYTKMLLEYYRDILASKKGERGRVQEILAKFGVHHRQTETRLDGLEPWEAYSSLHREFFQDPLVRRNREGNLVPQPFEEKLPTSAVMTEVAPARHVIYHQGKPEITFGVDRKLVAENASLSNFIDWLQRRQQIAALGYGDRADEVLALASQRRAEKGGTNLRGYLGEAINRLCREDPMLKSTLLKELEAQANLGELETEWPRYVANLKRIQATTDSEQLDQLLEEVKGKQAQAGDFRQRVNNAHQSGDRERLTQLAESTEAVEAMYPASKVEFVVTVGDQPVYYPIPGSDAIVFPDGELPSTDQYQQALAETRTRMKRMSGTISYVEKIAKNGHTPTGQTNGHIDQQTLADWQSHDATAWATLYDELDGMEAAGHSAAEIKNTANDRVQTLLAHRARGAEQAGISQEDVHGYTQEHLLPPALEAAKTRVLNPGLVAQREAVLADYQLILADIDGPQAEEQYRGLLRRVF